MNPMDVVDHSWEARDLCGRLAFCITRTCLSRITLARYFTVFVVIACKDTVMIPVMHKSIPAYKS